MSMTKVVYPGTFRSHHRGTRRGTARGGSVRRSGGSRCGQRSADAGSPDRAGGDGREVFRRFRQTVKVEGFDGLLMSSVRAQNARVVLRGLRRGVGFRIRVPDAGMNRTLHPDVETVFLTPAEQYTFIPPASCAEIARFGGDVSKFVSPLVVAGLKEKNQR